MIEDLLRKTSRELYVYPLPLRHCHYHHHRIGSPSEYGIKQEEDHKEKEYVAGPEGGTTVFNNDIDDG